MKLATSSCYPPEEDTSSIVNFVEDLLLEAITLGASDIHFEPLPTRLRIRFRCDGILREVHTLPQECHAPLLNRLKIMTHTMNIAEKRLPQEGRFEHSSHRVQVRVATMPSSYGEAMTLRLLNPAIFSQGLSTLGLDADDLIRLKHLLQRPHGLILITGPTGSGKTTTLYTCLQELTQQGIKVMTIEDPVEYRIQGVNQVQVHEDIGLTFSHALRSLLRQATNKMMVGEIRDSLTLESVLQASLTGHLVLSTLHTQDAPSAVTRLQQMGASSSLAASLSAVIAQRLVRRLCPLCKNQQPSCHYCYSTGFRGRIGIFEILILNDFLRHQLHTSTSLYEWEHLARQHCSKSLREDGLLKVAQGITTLEEILKATSS